MADTSTSDQPQATAWWACLGGAEFVRAVRMAISPSRIFLLLVALVLCFVWGTILDWVWVKAGRGVSAPSFVPVATAVYPGEPAAEEEGVFAAWWSRERWAVGGAVSAVRRLRFFGSSGSVQVPVRAAQMPPSELAGDYLGLLGCTRLALGSVVWVFTEHGVFAVLFFGGSLLVWAMFGGAVCRMNAVELGRDVRLELGDALSFARDHLWSGFFLAPLMPAIFVALLGLILCLGGMLFSVPWLGDVVVGLLFVLALGLGMVAAFAVVMSVAGGSFYWPAVASGGCDAMDGVLNGSAYLRGRPGRALWYLAVTLLLMCVTWLALSAFVWLGLRMTNAFVGLGTDVWTSREALAGGVGAPEGSKLDAIWSMGEAGELLSETPYVPTAGDKVSGFLVRVWIRLAAGVPWAAAISVWLACSTAAYLLLRREVDDVSMSDVAFAGPEQESGPGDVAGSEPPDTPASSSPREE